MFLKESYGIIKSIFSSTGADSTVFLTVYNANVTYIFFMGQHIHYKVASDSKATAYLITTLIIIKVCY